jgi:hypothetical protein
VLILALISSGLRAEVIVSYDSGVLPQSGASGAANPTGQGWTFSGGGNQFAAGYDSGNGGWRTVDGTSTSAASYSRVLSAEQITALTTADGWQVAWTIAMDEDAISNTGTVVTDYFVAPNNGRQVDIYTILQVDNTFNFFLSHRVDSNNQVFLRNENNTLETYNTGVFVSGSNPFPNFLNLSLTYSAATGDTILDYGGGTTILANGADPNQSRVFFGAGSSASQGSAVWNELTVVTVPEPSTLMFTAVGLGVAGLQLARRRR